MPALQIGTLEVKATDFRILPEERGGGGLRRTVNGQLRGRSDWVKRSWSATLYAEDETELAAIQLRADPDADISVSGDLMGVTVSCRVTISGEVAAVRDGTGAVYYTVPIALREV